MTDKHKCLHEEQFLGQSRAIEKLNAEMNYKKEKLDDLKEDNRRMEEKIDDIKECINELVVKSKTDDDRLEKRFVAMETDLDKRLVKIETEQKVLKEQEKKNRENTNLKLTIVTIVFAAISLLIGGISIYVSL